MFGTSTKARAVLPRVLWADVMTRAETMRVQGLSPRLWGTPGVGATLGASGGTTAPGGTTKVGATTMPTGTRGGGEVTTGREGHATARPGLRPLRMVATAAMGLPAMLPRASRALLTGRRHRRLYDRPRDLLWKTRLLRLRGLRSAGTMAAATSTRSAPKDPRKR